MKTGEAEAGQNSECAESLQATEVRWLFRGFYILGWTQSGPSGGESLESFLPFSIV